jgi:hypothetical protein
MTVVPVSEERLIAAVAEEALARLESHPLAAEAALARCASSPEGLVLLQRPGPAAAL